MSDELDKEESRGFKVQDRRRFTDEGELREKSREDRTASETTESRAQSGYSQTGGSADPLRTGEPLRQEDRGGEGKGIEEPDKGAEELPPINFSTFVISLSTQALMLLGEINDPDSGMAQKDVAVAKQTIDIIAMLEEKCRGNLDEHEERLIREVLYNLRMRYVEAVRQK